MKLNCPYCRNGSFVPDAAVFGAARELRCQQCRTEIPLATQVQEGVPTRAELFDGRYEKLGAPAEGGLGLVYPAYDRTLRTFVAVKELNSTTPPARFEREIELGKTLTHENIVAIYDHGESREIRYLTMEYLEGASLDRLLVSEQISYERALDLMIMACQGLEYVHVRGLVHRAVEPAKLFVTSDGALKLMGFGSAVSENEEAPALEASAIATRGYAAPEQPTATSATPRADVWSIGAVAYRLFTGVLPPASADRQPAPPSALNARVPPELDAVLLRALAGRPEDRPADAGELCEQLMALRRKYAPQVVAAAPITSIRPGATTLGQRSPRVMLRVGVAAAAVLGGSALLMRGGEARHASIAAPSAHRAVAPRAAAVGAREQSLQQALPPQAEPVAPGEPGPRAMLSAPRCSPGAESVPAGELQLAQPRPRAWTFAEHTLPSLPLDGFCMDTRSVSVAAYAKCVEEGRCTPHEANCTPSSDPNAAMKCVSWDAAQRYCASRGATLPSVAQWEAYAQSVNARISTSEWSLDAFPPAVFDARCNEDNPARCDGHMWHKAGRLQTVGPDGKGQLALSWNRGAATSASGYDYVSFRCATLAPAR